MEIYVKICILSTTKGANLKKTLREPLHKIVDSIDEADTVIAEPGADISKIPLSKRSFFFPINKLSSNERYVHMLLAQLSKDQTVWTRYYDFYDETPLPTDFGDFILFGFSRRTDSKRILGLRTKELPKIVTVRTHSMCYTGDIFSSKRCDCREELENALRLIAKRGGILIYPEEEGRGIGILQKIKIYNSQQIDGFDTFDAQYINHFPNDLRNYDYLRDVFRHYNIDTIDLITNNPEKVVAAEMSGVKVRKTVRLPSTVNDYNKDYLQTKMKKSGHNFTVEFATEES